MRGTKELTQNKHGKSREMSWRSSKVGQGSHLGGCARGKKKSQRGFVRFGLQIPRDITRIYPISLSGAALLDVNLQNSQD